MTAAETTCELIGIDLTPAQIAAARYLEMSGLRFAVDFGYENACALAKSHWLGRKEKGARQ